MTQRTAQQDLKVVLKELGASSLQPNSVIKTIVYALSLQPELWVCVI